MSNIADIARRNAEARRAMLDRLHPVAPIAAAAARSLRDSRGNAAGVAKGIAAMRDLRGIPGFFPTPPAIVSRLMELVDIRNGTRCCEPEAGKGNIADEMRQRGGVVTCAEINYKLREILEGKGYTVAPDFLDMPVKEQFDVIVANPPFENGQDREHVQRMYLHLNPGGRLASVMGEGVFYRSYSADVSFREWLTERGAYIEECPEKAFACSERPTGVRTRIVVINKPERV